MRVRPHWLLGTLIAAAIVAACNAAVSAPSPTAPSSVLRSAPPSVAPSAAVQSSAVASLRPGASPPADLIGKTWKLTAITEITPPFQATVAAADHSTYTIEFRADGTFDLTTDCDQISGRYAVYRGDGQNNLPLEAGGGDISFLPRPSTSSACPSASLADHLLTALQNTSGFGIDSTELTITLTDDGKVLFRA